MSHHICNRADCGDTKFAVATICFVIVMPEYRKEQVSGNAHAWHWEWSMQKGLQSTALQSVDCICRVAVFELSAVCRGKRSQARSLISKHRVPSTKYIMQIRVYRVRTAEGRELSIDG